MELRFCWIIVTAHSVRVHAVLTGQQGSVDYVKCPTIFLQRGPRCTIGKSRSFPAASAAALSFLRLHAALRVLPERSDLPENFGKELSRKELRAAFERLIDEGCQNINLVTPTHFLPSILPALTPKLPVPVVYNCGGYESVETLRELDGLIDISAPRFKYSDAALAKELSAAPEYPQDTVTAILEMYRQVGGAVIEDEQMTRGVIIRHLVLPGCIDNSLGVLDWIADYFPKKDVLVSLMSQYVPMGHAKQMPPFDRRITQDEYDAVLSYLYLLELDNGYTQDFSAGFSRLHPGIQS